MISDENIILALAIYFSLQGLIHFVFGKKMEAYAIEGGLLNATVAVRMSGALMLAGSILLYIPEYQAFGFYAFCIFLILSALILHKFWIQPSLLEQITEFLHFGKNIILVLLIWHLHGAL